MANWVVVLTGGIGSGKSLAATAFNNRGIVIVEQDDVSREVVEPGEPALDEIVEHFGQDILLDNSNLDRNELRRRIFNNPEDKIWLERLLHPLIGIRTIEHVRDAESEYAIVVNPLLRTRQPQYDRFIVVDTNVETQIERAMQRDSMSRELATKMLSSQIDRDERLRLADDVITNLGLPDEVDAQVDRLHRRYLVMSG